MPLSYDTAVELVRDLLELQRIMRRVARAEPGGRRLNPTTIALLSYLHGTGPVRATAMAADTGLGPSGLSRQLAALEESGLVERSPDPQDGRAALVAVTERGRAALRAAVEQDAQRLASRLEGWDEEQARASRAAIHEITTVFLESPGTGRTTSSPGPGACPPDPARADHRVPEEHP